MEYVAQIDKTRQVTSITRRYRWAALWATWPVGWIFKRCSPCEPRVLKNGWEIHEKWPALKFVAGKVIELYLSHLGLSSKPCLITAGWKKSILLNAIRTLKNYLPQVSVWNQHTRLRKLVHVRLVWSKPCETMINKANTVKYKSKLVLGTRWFVHNNRDNDWNTEITNQNSPKWIITLEKTSRVHWHT